MYVLVEEAAIGVEIFLRLGSHNFHPPILSKYLIITITGKNASIFQYALVSYCIF